MLTDTALRKLKPNGATYKVADRDGMYVTVSKNRHHHLSLRLPSQWPARNPHSGPIRAGRYFPGPGA